ARPDQPTSAPERGSRYWRGGPTTRGVQARTTTGTPTPTPRHRQRDDEAAGRHGDHEDADTHAPTRATRRRGGGEGRRRRGVGGLAGAREGRAGGWKTRRRRPGPLPEGDRSFPGDGPREACALAERGRHGRLLGLDGPRLERAVARPRDHAPAAEPRVAEPLDGPGGAHDVVGADLDARGEGPVERGEAGAGEGRA